MRRGRRAACSGLAVKEGLAAMVATEETLAWTFDFPAIGGGTLALGAFKGRVLLVTNTASFCGYTYQYKDLEKLHTALVRPVIDFVVDLRIDSSAMTEMHRDRETYCRKEVCREAQR
jgi:hypothetical protein